MEQELQGLRMVHWLSHTIIKKQQLLSSREHRNPAAQHDVVIQGCGQSLEERGLPGPEAPWSWGCYCKKNRAPETTPPPNHPKGLKVGRTAALAQKLENTSRGCICCKCGSERWTTSSFLHSGSAEWPELVMGQAESANLSKLLTGKGHISGTPLKTYAQKKELFRALYYFFFVVVIFWPGLLGWLFYCNGTLPSPKSSVAFKLLLWLSSPSCSSSKDSGIHSELWSGSSCGKQL